MKLKNEKEYNDWKANQKDGHGQAVFRYAEAWADAMEVGMKEGNSLTDIAEDLSHKADTEGITGFMYGCAVSILARCWEHGEELRQWHNLKTQLQDEGEKANKDGGVLNPAILNIGNGKSNA